MNDRQNAKLNMYQSVYNTCLEYAPVYSGTPVFLSSLNALNQGIAHIRETERQQADAEVKGTTQEKAGVEDLLVQSLLKTGSAVNVYAFENGDTDLQVKSNLNKSMLYRMENNVLLATATEIVMIVTVLILKLKDYGIIQSDLDELVSRTAAFESLIVKPRTTIDKHKLYTQNLMRCFSEADSILFDKLDKLINLFKTSSPDFYLNYKIARNIINTSVRKRHPETENTDGNK
ncbi:MAG: hypothetical protein LBT83_00290 [Tannerella sp.]|jgi:hypothetical protein|nr:hypothetical protein [Tannerella sp.]